ncbi:MAG: histidinol-phosphatase HisJ family protein [Anaerolineae bacterium]|nr:histidinol-phosphatase HisJ family protein [Anaerolineae bacterium]
MTQSTPSPILYDSHMHTPLCKHSRGEPEEFAAVAEKRNLKGIVVTCHNPGPTPDFSPKVRMTMAQFDEYVTMVGRARQTWAERIDIRLGLECDYVPGMEPFLEALLTRAEFHHVLGSIHPMLGYYKKVYDNGDDFAFQQQYFEHLAQSAESGLFDTLSHPDLVKIMFPRTWRVEPLLNDIRHSLDRIAKTGVAMELNTSGLNKPFPEMNPSPTMLAEMQQRGIPVVLGSDSHEPGRVAANFEDALDLLTEAGYTHISFFLNRERQEVGIENGRSSLIR